MHQHTCVADIIGVEVFDLEVVNLNRALKQFVLDLFQHGVFAVQQNEDITRSELRCACPALLRYVERVRRRCDDLFAVDRQMNQFVGFVDIGLDDLLERNLAGFFVPRPDAVARPDRFDRLVAVFRRDGRACYKARAHRQDHGTDFHCCIQYNLAYVVCRFVALEDRIAHKIEAGTCFHDFRNAFNCVRFGARSVTAVTPAMTGDNVPQDTTVATTPTMHSAAEPTMPSPLQNLLQFHVPVGS